MQDPTRDHAEPSEAASSGMQAMADGAPRLQDDVAEADKERL